MNSKVMNKVLSFLLVAAVAFTTIFTPVNAATVNSRDKKLKGKIKSMTVMNGTLEIQNKDIVQLPVGGTLNLTVDFVDKSEKKAASHQVVVKSSNKKALTAVAGYDKELNESAPVLTLTENAKAGDKIPVTIKSKAKKVKTVKFTVEVIDQVPVTGVTLDNTAPKVGDTINAKVEPADATNPTFAWAADGTPILGATTASYVVGEADLGKKISVTVTGVDGATFTAETAAVEAAAGSDLAITEAKQTAASDFTVKFNQAVDLTNFDFAVKRGATAQTITTSIADDQLSAVITLATAIGAADYEITVTPKDTTKKPASATVKGEVSQLADIVFASDKLVLVSADGLTGAVIVKGVDQFGAEVTFTKSNLKLYSSVSTEVEYDPDTKQVYVTAPTALPLTQGSQVTVSLVYTKGTTVIQKTATLTVSAVAYVAEGSFGDLATSNSTLKDKRVTLKNFADDSYYVPFEAKDQYGNALNAKQLEQMKDNNLLFITPSSDMTSYYAYFYKFDTVDKKAVIRFKHGATTPGTVQMNVVSVGGSPIAGSFTIEDNPFIDTLDVSVPELYKGSDAELVLTAKDQYGDDINFWDFESNIARADSTGTASTTTIQMGDKNNLTKSGTQIAVSSGQLKFAKDSIKKTIKFTYTPGTTANDTLTVTTATPTVSTQQLTINDQGIPGGVRMKSTAVTSVSSTQSFSFNKNLEFLDNYGAVMKSNLNSNTPVFTATATATITASGANRTTCGGDYIYTITTSTAAGAAFVADTTTTADLTDYKPAQDATASQDFLVAIYGPALKDDGTAETTGYRLIKSETFTLNSVKSTDMKYSVGIKDNKTLHVGKDVSNTTPSVTVQLSAVDANGKATVADQTMINKIDAGKFVLNGHNIIYDSTYAKGLTAAGTQEVKVYVNTVAEPLTCTLNYDVAASKDTTYKFTDSTGKDVDAAIRGTAADLYINTKHPEDPTAADDEYYTWVEDQYGDQMSGLKLTKVSDGSEVGDGAIGASLPAYALRYNDNEVIQVAAGTNVTVHGATAATAAVKTVTWGGASLSFGVDDTTSGKALNNHKISVKDSSDSAQALTNSFRVVIKNSDGKEEINTTGAANVSATVGTDGLQYDGTNKTITSNGTTPIGTYTITVTSLTDGTSGSATFVVAAGVSPVTGITSVVLTSANLKATDTFAPTVTFTNGNGHEYGTLKLYDQGTSTGSSTSVSYVVSTCTNGTFSTVPLTRGHYYYGVWEDSPAAYTTQNTYNVSAVQFAYVTAPTITAAGYDVTTNKATLTTETDFVGTLTFTKDADNYATVVGTEASSTLTGITGTVTGSLAAGDTCTAVINWDDGVYGASTANTTITSGNVTISAS